MAEVISQLASLGVKRTAPVRRETRTPLRGIVSLQTLSPLSLVHTNVEILDASQNGYGLLTNTFLEPGTVVYLRTAAAGAIGTIRHCKRTSSGAFKTGVNIQRDREPAQRTAARKTQPTPSVRQ